MTDRSTNEVGMAVDNLPEGIPFAGEIRTLLSRAYAEAREDEEHWIEQDMPHLRTFLKTTPLGLAILDLARTVNEGEPLAEHDRQVAEEAWDRGHRCAIGYVAAPDMVPAGGYVNPYRSKGEQNSPASCARWPRCTMPDYTLKVSLEGHARMSGTAVPNLHRLQRGHRPIRGGTE